VISGGGARNPRWSSSSRPGGSATVVPFDRLFFDGEAKEALVFAFLGFLTVLENRATCRLPPVRGARACSAISPPA